MCHVPLLSALRSAAFILIPTIFGKSNPLPQVHAYDCCRLTLLVCAGLDRALVGACRGEQLKVSVPPQLGYGSRGLPPAVPAGAMLLFDVEVRSVTAASHTAATLVGVGLLLCAVAAAAVNTQQRRDRECCSSRYSDPAAADADGGGGPAYSLVTGTTLHP